MKKIFILLATALFAVSCEGPMGPVGPKGDSGEDGVANKVYNYDLEIRSSAWKTGEDDFGPHYYGDLIIPELDEYMIYDGDGLYQLMWRYSEDGYEIRQTLETTIYHKDEGSDYLWSENISCQFSVGEARVIVRYSDFDMNRTPATMQFLFAGIY